MGLAWKPKKEVKEAQYLSRTVNTWAAFFSLLSSSSSPESAKHLWATWHQSLQLWAFLPPFLGNIQVRKGPLVCFVSWALGVLSLGWVAPRAGPYLLRALI